MTSASAPLQSAGQASCKTHPAARHSGALVREVRTSTKRLVATRSLDSTNLDQRRSAAFDRVPSSPEGTSPAGKADNVFP